MVSWLLIAYGFITPACVSCSQSSEENRQCSQPILQTEVKFLVMNEHFVSKNIVKRVFCSLSRMLVIYNLYTTVSYYL